VTTPIFVDTSAYFAALDRADDSHATATVVWARLLDEVSVARVELITHSGVVTETIALVQHRLGLAAVRSFVVEFLAITDVVWVDHDLHTEATTALLAAGRHDVSLVDWTSFVVMRRRGIDQAFAFDGHFTEQGFTAFG